MLSTIQDVPYFGMYLAVAFWLHVPSTQIVHTS